MPTITIDMPAIRPAERRAISVRLARWLSGHGVRPAHVVVRFADAAAGSLFSGGMPVDALPHGGRGLRYASVTCCVAPDRDEDFQAELAGEIAAALGLTEDTSFLYIEFRPTPPSRVYVARGGRLSRGDEPAPAPSRPGRPGQPVPAPLAGRE